MQSFWEKGQELQKDWEAACIFTKWRMAFMAAVELLEHMWALFTINREHKYFYLPSQFLCFIRRKKQQTEDIDTWTYSENTYLTEF